jgi:hypothetical protein
MDRVYAGASVQKDGDDLGAGVRRPIGLFDERPHCQRQWCRSPTIFRLERCPARHEQFDRLKPPAPNGHVQCRFRVRAAPAGARIEVKAKVQEQSHAVGVAGAGEVRDERAVGDLQARYEARLTVSECLRGGNVPASTGAQEGIVTG